MTSADHYRTLAAQCDAKARHDADAHIRAEWEHMGRAYRRLAEQAERNAQTDLTYETPPARSAASPVQQQQQQPQANPESRNETGDEVSANRPSAESN
jgi:hypothetical protein